MSLAWGEAFQLKGKGTLRIARLPQKPASHLQFLQFWPEALGPRGLQVECGYECGLSVLWELRACP